MAESLQSEYVAGLAVNADDMRKAFFDVYVLLDELISGYTITKRQPPIGSEIPPEPI
jgi:hypothetical protein